MPFPAVLGWIRGRETLDSTKGQEEAF